MSLLILSPETVWNPEALDINSAPRRLADRIAILPRREAGRALILRAAFENQLIRYIAALLPLVLAMLFWPHLALPISQAPVPMLILITFVEMRILRLPAHKRTSVTTEAAASRTLDTLGFRARQILSRIAAGRQIAEGELYLSVEQSELAKIAPLTVVSVQMSAGKSRLMSLTAEERQMIRDTLFDDTLTERDLQAANLRENRFYRVTTFEARAVTAHARLAALLDRPTAGPVGVEERA
jgi:hypothetical protein